MNIIQISKRIVRYAAYFLAALIFITHVSHGLVRASSFNPEINYQGKLADNTGTAVDNDGYNMRFKLFTVSTGGAEIWSETLCYSADNGDSCTGSGTDQRPDVVNGLFSVLLGDVSTTSLASLNFNQDLWLEVAIGGTSTAPSWETLSPRKKLGTVPSAFQADQLDGLDSLQFLRSDATDTMSASSTDTLLTIDQDGSGDVLNIFSGSTEYFSVLASGAVGVNNDSPSDQLSVGGGVGITADEAALRFYQGSNYVGFQASSSLSGNQIWVLPDADATTSGQALVSDGAGNLLWQVVGGGGASDYLSLSDTPSSFTASAIPFTNTAGDALLHSSGLTFTDTNDVLTVGAQQLYGFGTGNLFLGESTGNTTLSGENNIAIGAFSGVSLTSGRENTFIGRRSGNLVTTANFNTLIGYQAGANTASDAGTFIGYNAGTNNTTGPRNTFVGQSAGLSNNTGTENTFLGALAGAFNQSGSANVYVGHDAGNFGVTESDNVFIGINSGRNAFSSESVYIGHEAGRYALADDNTFVGTNAGLGVNGSSSGANNSFFGYNAGYGYTTGGNNSFFGHRSGQALTTGENNTFMGFRSGFLNQTGSANIFIGYQAGYNATSSNKLYIENSDSSTPLIYGEFDNDIVTINGTLNIGGSSNELRFYQGSNYVGFQASSSLSGNQIWVLPDADATTSGQALVSDGAGNLLWQVVGGGGASDYLSLSDTPSSFTASAIPFTNTAGDALLHSSGFTFTDTNDVLTVGTTTIFGIGGNNIFFGENAGTTSVTGVYNVALGDAAGASLTDGQENTLVGYQAGNSITTSDYNVFVGFQSGLNANGSLNSCVGYRSCDLLSSGNNNVALGRDALGAATSQAGNVALGAEAGNAAVSSNGIFVGRSAGKLVTSGANNILIGYQAGDNLTDGADNIIIGYDMDATGASASNELNIGGLIFGDLANDLLSIGTSTVSHTLAVAGSFDVNSGAINYATSTNVTSIERLNLGNVEFEENAGVVSWFDMSVTSAAATGTIMSYTAQIDNNELLRLYSESDGSGGIDTTRVVIGSASGAVLESSNIPDGSLIVANGALCVDNGSGDNCDDAALTPGQIYAESTSVTAVDLAENFPTRDASLEAAELVMFDPDNPVFVKTFDPADPKAKLMGVVSTQPGLLLGGFGRDRYQNEAQVPVALAGRVPIKVVIEGDRGIAIGDRLSSSDIPGVATRAGAFDQTVGVALEPIEAGTEGVQEILVFVNLQNGTSERVGSIAGLQDQIEAWGGRVIDDVVNFARLTVKNLMVGSADAPTGITIFDTVTRSPYCITIANGQQRATPGACGEAMVPGVQPVEGSDTTGSTDGAEHGEETSQSGEGESATDSQPENVATDPGDTVGQGDFPGEEGVAVEPGATTNTSNEPVDELTPVSEDEAETEAPETISETPSSEASLDGDAVSADATEVISEDTTEESTSPESVNPVSLE